MSSSQGVWCSTFIVLVPKKDCAVAIGFHPIGLLGNVCNMLATFLANQLQRCMPLIISNEKGAFVEGRQVLGSVLIARECTDSRNQTRRLGVIFQLDFEEAYYMVGWDILITLFSIQDLKDNGGIGKRCVSIRKLIVGKFIGIWTKQGFIIYHCILQMDCSD